jgi:DNA polymerase III subunit beta
MMARAATKPKPEAETPAQDARKPATRVRAGALHAALKDVLGVVQAKNTIPILSHVRLAAGDGRIELMATDLDLWAIRDLASEVPEAGERPFSVTLPAKPLADVLGEFDPDATVRIEAGEAGESRATVSAARARFRLLAMASDEFPTLPDFAVAHSFELPCAALADSFAAVEHAVSTEETRYYLNGIYLHAWQEPGRAQQLRLAATDGQRLARLALDPPDGAASFPSAIVSRRTVALLDRLLTSAVKSAPEGGTPPAVLVESAEHDHLIRWALPASDGGEIEVLAKTIDGTFPDYTRVIPTANEHEAVIERVALAEAIRRVSVLAPKESRCVKAEFAEDRLTLSVTSAELGEAREELSCAYAGPEIAIGFNGAFWLQALAALADDEVAMRLHDPGAPTLLVARPSDGEDPRLVQVLMPMRVA